jgi:hypothetical protein
LGTTATVLLYHGAVRPALATLLCLASCAGEPSSPAGQEPFCLHPRNPHYFLFRGRPTVLVTSGEHYGAVLNLDFDYVKYLNTLAADGLNHTRLWAGGYREIPGSFGITDNTLAPAPGRFACPWGRSGDRYDLRTWDDAYFARLADFMAQASIRGIVVEVNLWCPNYNSDHKDLLWKASPLHTTNNLNAVGACPGDEVYALKHPDLTAVQEATTRKVVHELNAFDNLYFEICNEPYFEGVTAEWQHHIADVIVDTEKTLPNRHLISQNIANGRAKVQNPHPAVSIFNFHYCVPPDAVGLNYGLDKAIGENETGFRGRDDVLYRTEGWDFILAGGAIYNNLDYSFTTKCADGTFLAYSSPGGGNPAFRRQMKVLKDFIHSFDFVRMRPDRGVIKAGVPAGMEAWALAETGRQYALYVHPTLGKGKPAPPRAAQIEILLDAPAGDYAVTWINPQTGSVDKQGSTTTTGALTLKSPPFTEDAAVRVVRR